MTCQFIKNHISHSCFVFQSWPLTQNQKRNAKVMSASQGLEHVLVSVDIYWLLAIIQVYRIDNKSTILLNILYIDQ